MTILKNYSTACRSLLNFIMDFTHRHVIFHNHCRQLIGLKIVKVKYAEALSNIPDPEPQYKTHIDAVDSVDYAVFLYTATNDVIEVCWDTRFVQYEIGVKINESAPSPIYRLWDVSNHAMWKGILASTIINVTIGWQEINTYKPGQKGILGLTRAPKTVSPQYIVIAFSNGQCIYISASQFFGDEEEASGMLSNLLITNNKEVARRVNMIE